MGRSARFPGGQIPHELNELFQAKCNAEEHRTLLRYFICCALDNIIRNEKHHPVTQKIANADPHEQDSLISGLHKLMSHQPSMAQLEMQMLRRYQNVRAKLDMKPK